MKLHYIPMAVLLLLLMACGTSKTSTLNGDHVRPAQKSDELNPRDASPKVVQDCSNPKDFDAGDFAHRMDKMARFPLDPLGRSVCYVHKANLPIRETLPIAAFFFGTQTGIASMAGIPAGMALVNLVEVGFKELISYNYEYCFFEGGKEALQIASGLDRLKYFVWLGHGAFGTVESSNGGLITPSSVPVFKSKVLDRVTMVSCQVGQQIDQWNRIFSENSPRVVVDASPDNIPVDYAYEYLRQTYLPSLKACKEPATMN